MSRHTAFSFSLPKPKKGRNHSLDLGKLWTCNVSKKRSEPDSYGRAPRPKNKRRKKKNEGLDDRATGCSTFNTDEGIDGKRSTVREERESTGSER